MKSLPKSQRGVVSLGSIMVALLIAGSITVAMTAPWQSQREDGYLKETIAYAKKIARVADRLRQTATGTVVVNDVYTHTYKTLPANATVPELDAALGAPTDLPASSPFGTPYQINVTDEAASVTVRVPLVVTPDGTEATPAGGGSTDLTVTAVPTDRARLGNGDYVKSWLYQESSRW